MLAIRLTSQGENGNLELVELPTPEPEDEEVLIKVYASGVNFAEVLARQGYYPDAPSLPFIPGYEVAGKVISVGKNITGINVNDRVMALTWFGGYAQYVTVPAHITRQLPDHVDFIQAAGFPVIFTTAYHCLYQTGPFKKGSKVLIHAATGGLGQAAIQLCKLQECTILGTAGSNEKIKLLKKLGVHYPINYSKEDFENKITHIFPEPSLDIILDSIGGNNVIKGLHLLKPNGRIITLGVASISGKHRLNTLWNVWRFKKINHLQLLGKSIGIHGVNILRVFQKNLSIAMESYDESVFLLNQKKLNPPISRVLPLSKANEALTLLQNRSVTGKIVLTPQNQ